MANDALLTELMDFIMAEAATSRADGGGGRRLDLRTTTFCRCPSGSVRLRQ
jgi:hypothetical protein